MNRTEKTRDISSGGICFLSGDQAEVGDRVEYLITLSHSLKIIRLRCQGKVLRSASAGNAGSFKVAVTMDHYQFLRIEGLENKTGGPSSPALQ